MNIHKEQLFAVRTNQARAARSTWIRRIIGCAGLLLAGWLAFSAKPTPALPSAEIASVSNHSASLGDTHAASGILSGKAIEEIRVGDRVAAYNPEVADSERAGWVEPDAATWEVIDLEMPKRDGGLLEISLLRPKSWLADQQATVGSEVYLDSRELNAIGNAKVLAIRPCPAIESGSGRVVVGTFKHNSSDIVDIFVSSQTSPIGTTSDHPFWSRDRQAFVPAAKLLPGEKLLSIDGATLQVTAVTPRATPSAVYNLEIQGEHAYAVSDAGVVVHNNQPYLKSANAIDDVGEVALDPYMKRLSDWAKSPANPANGKTVTSSSGIPNRLLRRQPGADHVAGGYVVDWKIIDGLFYSADGSTLIHFGKNYRGASEGIDFVIGMDGQLRLGSRHTYLAALGGDASHALAAGTLRISRGKITSITNLSGHFNPTVSEAKQFPEVFRKAGFDLTGRGLTVYVPRYTTGIYRYTKGTRRDSQEIIK